MRMLSEEECAGIASIEASPRKQRSELTQSASNGVGISGGSKRKRSRLEERLQCDVELRFIDSQSPDQVMVSADIHDMETPSPLPTPGYLPLLSEASTPMTPATIRGTPLLLASPATGANSPRISFRSFTLPLEVNEEKTEDNNSLVINNSINNSISNGSNSNSTSSSNNNNNVEKRLNRNRHSLSSNSDKIALSSNDAVTSQSSSASNSSSNNKERPNWTNSSSFNNFSNNDEHETSITSSHRTNGSLYARLLDSKPIVTMSESLKTEIIDHEMLPYEKLIAIDGAEESLNP